MQDLPLEWQQAGACTVADPDTFFSPDAERGPSRRNREAAAKALCRTCPVIDTCREHALATKEPYGVWGGLTIRERAAILRPSRQLA